MRWLIAAALSVFAALADAAHAQFIPDDQIVSDPIIDLNDPEFDPVGNRMAWQDTDGNLWVAFVDPVTGDITPTSGKGQLVDTGLVPIGDSLNGPEWSYDGVTGKSYILYSKLVDGAWSLGVARDDGNGGWTTALPSRPFSEARKNRWRPFGSPSGTTAHARQGYLYQDGPDQILAWRYVGAPNTELTLPGAKIGARFIEGLDAFVTTMRINDINQVVYVDATTGAYQQLTHDLVNRNGPFMWFAPDVGEHGEYVFMAMMNTTKIGIWRQDANGAWYLYYKFNIPSAKEYVSSPEPFVYNGKSYIITVAALQLGEVGNFPYQPIGQTEIWIAGIDPNNPFFRRVDDSRGGHHRVDPEVYATLNDAFIYYTERDNGETISTLRRAATGLGPGGN